MLYIPLLTAKVNILPTRTAVKVKLVIHTTTFKIDVKYQIIWAFSRTFSIITAFHDIPLVIYPFNIVLNAFNCTTVVLVHIVGIIAHYRELLSAVWLCFIFFEYSASGYYGHYCPLPGSTQSFLVVVCAFLSLMFLLSIFACFHFVCGL